MKDSITIQRVKLLHPKIMGTVETGIDAAETKLGQRIAVRVVQGFRSFPEQDALYAIGRTVKGSDAKPGLPMGRKVTNAKGGYSNHNYGLAFDFALLYDKDNNGTFEDLSWDLLADMNRDGESDWKEVVEIFTELGFVWGGNWKTLKDNPHLENTFGHPVEELLQRYNSWYFYPGTKFVVL